VILISERAHVIFPTHVLLDGIIDENKGKLAAGTTKRGIGPAYMDKADRSGIRMVDFVNPQAFKEKFNALFERHLKILKNIYNYSEEVNQEEIFQQYSELAEQLKPYVGDTSLMVNQAIDSGQKVLFEGAQGTSLDIDHGVYPHNTSSNTTIGAVCTGAGVSPKKIDKIMGVVKAYLSRVGAGPLPTEEKSELGDHLRERGGEYGTTTGRPRRCGWLDLVQVRYAQRLNGFTSLVITKIDVVGGLKEIPLCTKYKYQDQEITEIPANNEIFAQCQPVYEMMPGWDDISAEDFKAMIATGYQALPANMRKYIERIEQEVGVPVEIVSVGPGREETIVR